MPAAHQCQSVVFVSRIPIKTMSSRRRHASSKTKTSNKIVALISLDLLRGASSASASDTVPLSNCQSLPLRSVYTCKQVRGRIRPKSSKFWRVGRNRPAWWGQPLRTKCLTMWITLPWVPTNVSYANQWSVITAPRSGPAIWKTARLPQNWSTIKKMRRSSQLKSQMQPSRYNQASRVPWQIKWHSLEGIPRLKLAIWKSMLTAYSTSMSKWWTKWLWKM